MTVLESGGLAKKTIEVGARVATSVKEGGTAAVEMGKSAGLEAMNTGSKAWERVKEGPVGMWVREKRANKLATKIDRQQQLLDELSGKIKEAGDDFSTVARLGEEQMMLVGKINKYADHRRELAGKLEGHYSKKLERPRAQRQEIQVSMTEAETRRDTLGAKNEKYKAVFSRFQERQSKLLASRAYDQSREMNAIAQSLAEMAKQMKILEDDIATENRVIEGAEKDIEVLDAKHEGTQQKLKGWGSVAISGRDGTMAARAQEVSPQPKSTPDAPKKIAEVPRENLVGEAANDNKTGERQPETIQTTESSAGGEALQAFLKEVLREDLREALQTIVDKQPHKDVINGQKAKGGVEQFVELWKQVAEAGKPKVEGFSSSEIKRLKENTGKVSLVEFGVLVSEETSLSIEGVKRGVEKIAERWNATLEKQQKQAA